MLRVRNVLTLNTDENIFLSYLRHFCIIPRVDCASVNKALKMMGCFKSKPNILKQFSFLCCYKKLIQKISIDKCLYSFSILFSTNKSTFLIFQCFYDNLKFVVKSLYTKIYSIQL